MPALRFHRGRSRAPRSQRPARCSLAGEEAAVGAAAQEPAVREAEEPQELAQQAGQELEELAAGDMAAV
jgi:hypothetical protein